MRARGVGRSGTGGRHGTALLLAIGLSGLAATGPAMALNGVDLLSDVCAATLPRFEGVADRIAAYRSQAISYDGRVLAGLPSVARQSAWTVNDGSDAKIDRFLVGVAWGTAESRPAASCFVADKRGFTLAELEAKFAVRDLRISPDRALYVTVATGVVDRADGGCLGLTLALGPGQTDLNPGTSIAVATLISSDYLNAPLEKAQ